MQEILSRKKTAVLERWFHLITETYPAETARFLRREKNRFANPVGHTIYQGIEGIYDELLRGMDPGRVISCLESIAKIRAVQDFSPSRATAFIFLLKKAMREELAGEIRESRMHVEELLNLESKVDDLALLSFDIYVECRERICEIRINEVKNRTARLLQRANLMVDGSVDHL